MQMARNSRDQIISGVKQRYMGPGGMLNVASDITKIVKLLNTENKHLDTWQSYTALPTSPIVVNLGNVAEGSDSNQRTGRSIKVNKIDIIWNFTFSSGTPATSSTTNQYFNYYVVCYLKTPSTSGGSGFGIGELFDQDGSSNDSVLSLINDDTDENFQVMEAGQVEITLPYLGTVATYKSKVVTTTHRCNFHQTFNGSSASTICDNTIFVVVTALNPLNSGGVSSVQINSRIWFIDN
jgi:hypothetical protein